MHLSVSTVPAAMLPRFNDVLTEYRNDRQTTRSRLYYEMIEDVFLTQEEEQETPELIDKNLSNFIPLLNLERGGTQ